MNIIDPIKFCTLCWPEIRLYDKQKEILRSVRDNVETYVPAGNALGKDFIASIVALWWMCSRRPARCVTTSVKYDQLNDVLWGEIRQRLDTCKVRLPIQYNHLQIRQVRNDGSFVPLAELVGQVVNKGESMLGRHLPRDIPRTLAIFDEASGIDDMVYESSDTWTHRKLIIGNPYPCNNFFYKGVKAGDLKAENNGHYHRKIIKIKAEDSPNIRLALSEIQWGEKLSGKVLVPGLIDYETYLQRRKMWDNVRQCIGLDAEFYEGAEVLLYPPDWLNRAETIARGLGERKAASIGIDPAEGGDNTVWAASDKKGLIELVSMKTPDTSIIPSRTLQFMHKHGVEAESVYFDRGGGGKEHADRMRAQGHKVNSVAFGESVKSFTRFRFGRTAKERMEEEETRYVYKNRRAQMYGMLRILLDPTNEDGWGIPEKYTELRRQLGPIPLMYDGEGRLELPPKNKRDPQSTKETMTDLIGCSPDEADALVLSVFGLRGEGRRRRATAF